MTPTLEMPQLSGGRRRAKALIDSASLPDDLSNATVIVDCRQLLTGTQSAALELVEEILVERRAASLRAINVDRGFAEMLRHAARVHDVSALLEVHE